MVKGVIFGFFSFEIIHFDGFLRVVLASVWGPNTLRPASQTTWSLEDMLFLQLGMVYYDNLVICNGMQTMEFPFIFIILKIVLYHVSVNSPGPVATSCIKPTLYSLLLFKLSSSDNDK